MRRVIYLALTLLLAASAAAFVGQKPASAQPLAIQVIATGPNTFQVSVNFSTDEIPVTFSAASGAALSLLSCVHGSLANCTGAVADTDPSPLVYNSGTGLVNFDSTSGQDSVTFVVSVVMSCSVPLTVVVVASQGGVDMSAPLVCGAPASSPYYPGPFPYYAPFYSNVVPVYSGYAFLLNQRPPYLGAAIGAIVFGASGTEKNLARHALQQVVQLLPAYLAAYGVDPSLGPAISQQIAAYANAYWSNPPSIQQIIQQIPAIVAAYAGAGQGPSFVPPRTGEAGLVGLYPDAEYPMVTYFGVIPPDEIVDSQDEFEE